LGVPACTGTGDGDKRWRETAMDQVRARYGGAVLTHAALLGSTARMDRERYAWREDVLG